MVSGMAHRIPPQEQIDISILWLESNEGDEGEADACKAVAAWIQHEATESMLRREARSAGMPVARLRRKLAINRKD